ncbi:MAG: hypothetical protein AAB461_03200 [Patescibacteria group bacterium]
MNKKLKLSIVLFIQILVLSSGADANAGLFDWATGQNTEWTFGNVYKSISKTGKPSNPDIQETAVLESQNPTVPTKTKAAPIPIREYVVTATAYSSTIDQTDDTPFITASQTYVRDGVIAANFLPFGTAVKIPDLYGDKIFIVEDRMNKRYLQRVDIWFPERQSALEFGIKQIRIEIVS